MLQTLASLGRVKNKQESTSIRHVVAMVFKYNYDGVIKYDKSELYGFDDPAKYLYQRDFSGKPGLFLTGAIPQADIKNLAKSQDNTKFIKKKILWFQHGKLVSEDKLSTLNDYRKKELSAIFEELKNKNEQIATDVIKILTGELPQLTWLTIMIQEQNEEAKFVGDIEDYVDFFARGILNKKHGSAEEKLVCGVCNKPHMIHPYSETPIPFFFSKKLHFFESADISNVARGFPVCHDCYTRLGNGVKFIKNRLDYRISTVNIAKKEQKLTESGIKFWLIPSMNNYELLERFKDKLGDKSLYYLDSLKELCSSLHLIQTYDVEDRHDDTDAFLRFSALFYTVDKKAYGLMRVLNMIHDIYPPQLRKLLSVKEKIDNQYPFRNVKDQEFFVGMPLLVTFFMGIKAQWESQIIGILNKMFTGQQIPIDQIIQNINLRVHQALRKSNDLEVISKIVLDGLMLLEYIITLNNNKSDFSYNQILMLNISTYEINHTERFIESHKSVLDTETKKGVFAAGVSTAILFDVQEKKYSKGAPFWDQLGRLDLNLQKVQTLIPKVKRHLAMYRNRNHDTIINYLTAQHVIDTSEVVAKDLVSYLFALGLSFGYLLVRKNLKDNNEEEVTE